jgi:hypothetical protein
MKTLPIGVAAALLAATTAFAEPPMDKGGGKAWEPPSNDKSPKVEMPRDRVVAQACDCNGHHCCHDIQTPTGDEPAPITTAQTAGGGTSGGTDGRTGGKAWEPSGGKSPPKIDEQNYSSYLIPVQAWYCHSNADCPRRYYCHYFPGGSNGVPIGMCYR